MSFDCLTFERMNLDVSLVDLDARNKNLGTLCTKSIRDQSVLAEVSLERSVKTCLGRGSIHQSHRSEIELFRHTKQKHIRNTFKYKTKAIRNTFKYKTKTLHRNRSPLFGLDRELLENLFQTISKIASSWLDAQCI